MIVNICLVLGILDGFPDLKPKHNMFGESDNLNVVKNMLGVNFINHG